MPRTLPYYQRILEEGSTIEALQCFNQDITVTLTRDGDGETEIVNIDYMDVEPYYIDIDFASSILIEGETYRMDVLIYGNLWYRDKVFVTDQSDRTIKHELTQSSYTPYDNTDDNTYIIG